MTPPVHSGEPESLFRFDALIREAGVRTARGREFVWGNAVKGHERQLADDVAAIEREATALAAPEPEWASTVVTAADQFADLKAAVELMDTKITPYGEREDGTTAAYIVADTTWHRVLAIARGHVSDKARAALRGSGAAEEAGRG